MNKFIHKHWKFVACDEIVEGSYKFGALAEVVDYETEETALQAIKKLLKRKIYILQQVWECKTCTNSEEMSKILKEYLSFAKRESED